MKPVPLESGNPTTGQQNEQVWLLWNRKCMKQFIDFGWCDDQLWINVDMSPNLSVCILGIWMIILLDKLYEDAKGKIISR